MCPVDQVRWSWDHPSSIRVVVRNSETLVGLSTTKGVTLCGSSIKMS